MDGATEKRNGCFPQSMRSHLLSLLKSHASKGCPIARATSNETWDALLIASS